MGSRNGPTWYFSDNERLELEHEHLKEENLFGKCDFQVLAVSSRGKNSHRYFEQQCPVFCVSGFDVIRDC